MDDVFNVSQSEKPTDVQRHIQDEDSTVVMKEEPRESAATNLDNVLASDAPDKPSDIDEEMIHIQKRIEEFKKAEEEQETLQRTTEPHSEQKIFDDSNISMDDVFNTSGSKNLKKSNEVDQEEEHIRRRIEEFKRVEEEKHIQQASHEDHSSHRIFDDSNISMDEVFGAKKKPVHGDEGSQDSSTITMRPPQVKSTASAQPKDEPRKEQKHELSGENIDLDDVFIEGSTSDIKNDDSDEKIKRGIAEFERSKQEKEMQRSGIVEPSSASRRFFDESNISMDDVFGSELKTSDDDTDVKSTSNITSTSESHDTNSPVDTPTAHLVEKDPSEQKVGRKSDDIDMDKIFVEGSAEKSDFDVSDEKIRRGIAEFERVKQEKEAQRTGTTSTVSSSRKEFDDSNLSMDDVFNPGRQKVEIEIPIGEHDSSSASGPKKTFANPVWTSNEDVTTTTKTTTQTEKETDKTSRRVYEFEPSSETPKNLVATETLNLDGGSSTQENKKSVITTADIKLDDVFVQGDSASQKNDDQDKKFQKGIADFERAKKEKEAQRSSTSEPTLLSERTFDEFSLDEVFNSEAKKIPEEESTQKTVYTSTSAITMRPASEKQTEEVHTSDVEIETKPKKDEKTENRTSAVSIDLDKVFVEGSSGKSDFDTSDEKIRRGIAEFERAKQEKEAQRTGVVVTTHSSKHLFDESDISMDDVFNTSRRTQESNVEVKYPVEADAATIDLPDTSKASASISLDNVFTSDAHEKPSEVDEEVIHIQKIIEEFKKAEEEQETLLRTTESHPHPKIFDDSNISMDDVFNTSGSKNPKKLNEVDQEEEHIRRRIEEFKRAEEEKQRTLITESHSTHQFFDASNISMDDVFNASHSKKPTEIQRSNQDEESTDEITEKKCQPETSQPDFEASSISLEDVFNKSRDSGHEKTTSESEKTTTTTTTRTETTSDSYSKRTVRTLDELFGPQTAIPPTISVSAISSDQPSSSPTPPPRKNQNLSSLLVPGKWNDSMMSNASTISLDDSFNNSFVKSESSQVYEPKMRKPLTLPVDNWIDNLVSKVTDEATREAPKTPKSAADNYYRSPTRISQEIKYEWVAKLIEDDGIKDEHEQKEEHQSEEEHLQKQDNTWVSSVVYRPTLETSAYILRSSQVEPEKRVDIDMDRVFNECLMLKKNDDEECECSACRLTEHELEQIKRRKIETENRTRQERQSASHDTDEHRHVAITNPSEFSINDVFNPETPLSIQTHGAPAPSTSSPPLESTRTHYISPKVSETVTTTHQWKDADISMDEIFSPVSSTTNENRRFSNFYEDRSGWDTIGSEDSGVMSGGDRGRRRSTRITDHVIDEAFKGIFDSQPTTSIAVPQPEQPDTQYDDYYITSLHQEDVRSSDSDVDPENLDVSQFVDDILGKSMDEAAFLSSTKSLKDHTDTSIDRKKSIDKIHSYYRTQTDTSIDRRLKTEVINEESETTDTHLHDELLKLVFVDPSDHSISKSESRRSLSLPHNRSITKPSDEELLEIEIKPDYFVIKGSYSLLIPKSDPLGLMLQKLREQNNGLATLDFSLTRKLKKLLLNCIRERAGCMDMSSASSKYEGLLSSRGQSLIESIDHASATFLKMNVDKYEPTRNPNGVVNFCTAENNICTPLLEERFKHLELFFPNTEHLVRYPPAGGWPEAREVLVKYFREFLGARVTVDELALTPSTRTGYDVTSYCLFEADDILLTNGPAYAGTISNVNEKAQCQVACVETDLSNPRLDVKMYEAELNRQIEMENTVSGVIIVNPHNPLGVTFPPEEVVNLCNWAASKNLHVVIDEVFANCVFDKQNSKFRPFLSYRHRVHRPENVAWLWSVSKDFGLPGLKFAVIHSANEGLRQAATKLQMYYPCSPFVQDFAINLLSDSDWLREFHAEVNRRISIHYRYTAQNLESLEIPFVPAQAGIFVFADFSKHLTTVDSAGELELFERLASQGVMLTPGVHQKCHVFGWFRIVFACTKEELEEGFRRLFVHLGSHLHPVGTVQYDN